MLRFVYAEDNVRSDPAFARKAMDATKERVAATINAEAGQTTFGGFELDLPEGTSPDEASDVIGQAVAEQLMPSLGDAHYEFTPSGSISSRANVVNGQELGL